MVCTDNCNCVYLADTLKVTAVLSELSNSTQTQAATAHSYTVRSANKRYQLVLFNHLIVMRKQTFAWRCDQTSRPPSIPHIILLFSPYSFNSSGIRHRGVCCLLTYLHTTWSRVHLENLTGLQLVKKFPALYGTRTFITAFTSTRHLSLS